MEARPDDRAMGFKRGPSPFTVTSMPKKLGDTEYSQRYRASGNTPSVRFVNLVYLRVLVYAIREHDVCGVVESISQLLS